MIDNKEIRPPHIYSFYCGEEHGLLTIRRLLTEDDQLTTKWGIRLESMIAAYVDNDGQKRMRFWNSPEEVLKDLCHSMVDADEFDKLASLVDLPSSLSSWQVEEPDQKVH